MMIQFEMPKPSPEDEQLDALWREIQQLSARLIIQTMAVPRELLDGDRRVPHGDQ